MIRYVFADDKVLAIKNLDKSDPQVIGEELERIKAGHNGDLEPDDIVREARAKHNPLHQNFEWDDSAAAHAHRLQQARALTRCIRSYPIEGDPEKAAPAFISISDTRGTRYKSAEDVMGSKQLQDIVLKQAERDLLAFQQRYRRFNDLFAAIEPVIRTVRKLRGEE